MAYLRGGGGKIGPKWTVKIGKIAEKQGNGRNSAMFCGRPHRGALTRERERAGRTQFAPTVGKGTQGRLRGDGRTKGGESTRVENMGDGRPIRTRRVNPDQGREAAMTSSSNGGTGEGQGPGERSSPLRWRGFMRILRFKPTNFGQNCVRPYGGGDLCGHYGSSRRILARTASDRVLTLSKSVAWM